MKLIDKEKVVKEIEKRLKANGAFDEVGDEAWAEDKGMCEAYRSILSFLNTLEVKEVKEPTASDRGMAEEIIIHLKRVEQDYYIDLIREMEWLRNITQRKE